jgi:plasmid maintenance system killer protein
MRFRFLRKKLERLYTEGKGIEKYEERIIENFLQVIEVISKAKDERDIRAISGIRFHKLQGDRKGKIGLTLFNQWRLTIVIKRDVKGKIVIINGIEDYH